MAKSLNKVLLLGNISTDAEIRYSQDGKPIWNSRLAVKKNYGFKDNKQNDAIFVPVIAFNRTAQALTQYTIKGSRLIVEGHLNIRNWEAKDGTRRWMTEVVITDFTIVSGGASHGQEIPKREEKRESPISDEEEANDSFDPADDVPF